jgi:dolichol-phosphate mannosyltransferase
MLTNVEPNNVKTSATGGASLASLAVVIPALNERENLELLLPPLRAALARLAVPVEVVVVDGDSGDGTAEVVELHGARIVQQHDQGYGGALLTGFAATSAPWILTMDADLSHRCEFLADLWKRRADGDIIIASRYVPGGEAAMGWLRGLLSRVLNRSFGWALALPIRDLSSGFRLYHRSVVEAYPFAARDFDALEEILIRAHNAGHRIVEVPFHYMPRRNGDSHVRFLRFARAFLVTFVRMWRLRNSASAADYDWRAFDSPVWLQRIWQRRRHRTVLELLEDRASVLDVGCGSSHIIVDLPAAVGLDIAHAKLRWLRPRHSPLVQATVQRLPFRGDSFGTVICSQLIEHLPDGPGILEELDRVLAPGGTLILGTPDYGRPLWWVVEWFYGKLLPDAYAVEHVTRFTRRRLARRLGELGYEILDCRYVCSCEMIFKARKPLAVAAHPPADIGRRLATGYSDPGDRVRQALPGRAATGS